MRYLFILFFICQFLQGQVIVDRFRFSGSAISALALDYDLNAESLSLGDVENWPNDGVGITTNANQPTASERPECINESGKKAVQFDGVDESLSLAQPTDLGFVWGTDTGTFIIVRGVDVGTVGSVLSDRFSSGRNVNIGNTSSTNFLVQMGVSTQFWDTTSGTGSLIYEVSVTLTGIDTYVDGVLTQDQYVLGTNYTRYDMTIGARPDGTNYSNGSIRRILIKKNKILTAQERIDVVAELQTIN